MANLAIQSPQLPDRAAMNRLHSRLNLLGAGGQVYGSEGYLILRDIELPQHELRTIVLEVMGNSTYRVVEEMPGAGFGALERALLDPPFSLQLVEAQADDESIVFQASRPGPVNLEYIWELVNDPNGIVIQTLRKRGWIDDDFRGFDEAGIDWTTGVGEGKRNVVLIYKKSKPLLLPCAQRR